MILFHNKMTESWIHQFVIKNVVHYNFNSHNLQTKNYIHPITLAYLNMNSYFNVSESCPKIYVSIEEFVWELSIPQVLFAKVLCPQV